MTRPVGSACRLQAAILLVVSLVFAACLASCGSGKSSSSPTTTVPELDSPSEAVEVIASSLQLELLSQGYHPAPVNGHFTPATQTALRKFQTVEDLVHPNAEPLGRQRPPPWARSWGVIGCCSSPAVSLDRHEAFQWENRRRVRAGPIGWRRGPGATAGQY
jgi:hypothetical protein